MVGLTNPENVIAYLLSLSDEEQANKSKRFFKTAPGDYGHGDKFIGIRMPTLRKLVPQAKSLSVSETFKLLNNEYHEVRLFALLLLNYLFKKSSEDVRSNIVKNYVEQSNKVNNWDLVDCSAYHILGPYLQDKDRAILVEMADSPCIWRQRMAIVSTYHFIKQRQLETTFEVAPLLFSSNEDLIHKAVGWMLKEAGKRDENQLVMFLLKNGNNMPKTMLRFAMEKLSKETKCEIKESLT